MEAMENKALLAIFDFIRHIDGLKRVERRSLLMDASRRENTAEHSWHLALSVILLQKQAQAPIDLDRAVRMALVHDLAEADVGDTFVYDLAAAEGKHEREKAALEKMLAPLPRELEKELMELWLEFEEKSTPEARFVSALDRLLPIWHNVNTKGHSWRQHGVRSSQVRERNREIAETAPELGALLEGWLETAVAAGHLER